MEYFEHDFNKPIGELACNTKHVFQKCELKSGPKIILLVLLVEQQLYESSTKIQLPYLLIILEKS